MNSVRILVIEDDVTFGDILCKSLQDEGYSTMTATSGQQAIGAAMTWQPNVILLDYRLPDADGFELCKRLKSLDSTRHIPIIMVTGRSSESDIVTALELGAEDFISKPFSSKILVAKIRVNLRRMDQFLQKASTDLPLGQIKIHNMLLDQRKYKVYIEQEEIKLTSTQFKILECLACKPGLVMSKQQIASELNAQNYPISPNCMEVQIAGLRKKLGTSGGDLIETVRGVGYRIKELSKGNANSQLIQLNTHVS